MFSQSGLEFLSEGIFFVFNTSFCSFYICNFGCSRQETVSGRKLHAQVTLGYSEKLLSAHSWCQFSFQLENFAEAWYWIFYRIACYWWYFYTACLINRGMVCSLSHADAAVHLQMIIRCLLVFGFCWFCLSKLNNMTVNITFSPKKRKGNFDGQIVIMLQEYWFSLLCAST